MHAVQDDSASSLELQVLITGHDGVSLLLHLSLYCELSQHCDHAQGLPLQEPTGVHLLPQRRCGRQQNYKIKDEVKTKDPHLLQQWTVDI